MAAHLLPKQRAAGSSPVSRSTQKPHQPYADEVLLCPEKGLA
jgi:hypothetical protein